MIKNILLFLFYLLKKITSDIAFTTAELNLGPVAIFSKRSQLCTLAYLTNHIGILAGRGADIAHILRLDLIRAVIFFLGVRFGIL